MLRLFVVIKTIFEAIHNWPDCNIEEVQFLQNEHRHRIFITVKVETTIDREIEFFVLKSDVEKVIDNLYGKDRLKRLGSKSMEKINNDIYGALTNNGYNITEVSAFEDNEVGSILSQDDGGDGLYATDE